MLKRRYFSFLWILFFVVVGILISVFLSRLDNNPSIPSYGSLEGQKNEEYGNPQRIICATPGIAEIVFTLECGDRVVGVSQFSKYPKEVQEKSVIGGLIDPHRERILALKPDLFLTQGHHQSMAAFCREHRIRFLSVQIERLDDIPEAVLFLGKTLKVEARAEKLAKSITEDIQEIRGKVQGRKKRTVFLSLGHTPGDLTGIMTAGKGTFLHELITSAGGINIFSDVKGKYPQISKEALVKRQPELIIEISGLPAGKLELIKQDWNKLSILTAVKKGKIYFLADDYLLIPGVRVAQTAEHLARIIHPEVFDE